MGTVLRPLPPPGRPRRRRLRTIQTLPTLITAGNLLAGVLALSYLVDAAAATGAARTALQMRAAWLVFLGMACDALDGRIARLMRVASPFGAQLDSLADVVTFGVVPTLLAKTVLSEAFPALPGKVALALGVVYALGAALRLARYNVESAAVAAGAGAHVTRTFRGLPSPAAAGTVAALLLLRHEYALHSLDWALLIATPALGLLMISRFPYSHVMNRYVDGPGGLAFVVLLAVTAFLAIAYFEATVAGLFVLYALTGPLVALFGALTGRLGWAFQEDADEDADGHPDGEAATTPDDDAVEGGTDDASRRPPREQA